MLQMTSGISRMSSAKKVSAGRDCGYFYPVKLVLARSFQAGEIPFWSKQLAMGFLNRSGVLVLADSFYPGWRVYVNGKEGEILKANYFFRGVVCRQGPIG